MMAMVSTSSDKVCSEAFVRADYYRQLSTLSWKVTHHQMRNIWLRPSSKDHMGVGRGTNKKRSNYSEYVQFE
uniref:Uncharacterized protein n=1 Tax=Timema monikensis TaxID=170555 RepID=A0A7R9HHK4_9NEOP|nr:unnamed protein product [Timema monikensis]